MVEQGRALEPGRQRGTGQGRNGGALVESACCVEVFGAGPVRVPLEHGGDLLQWTAGGDCVRLARSGSGKGG